MLVVDVSSSMLDANKWDYTKDTLVKFFEAYSPVVKGGIRTFPDGGCKASTPTAIALNNDATIKSNLTTPSASAQTPIAEALKGIEPQFGDPNEGQYVLLVTDGSETCDPKQTTAVLEAVTALRSNSIKTIAVGIGTTANMTLLNAVANEGGTGAAYQATDAAALTTALKSIYSTIIDCSDPCFGKNCGGTCGACTVAPNKLCGAFGTCECGGNCGGKSCGDDGCGGTCPPGCPTTQLCIAGSCQRFLDNGDGTISDYQTRLMWMKTDLPSGSCGASSFAGHTDWRNASGKCKSSTTNCKLNSTEAEGEIVSIIDTTSSGCLAGSAACVVSLFQFGLFPGDTYKYFPRRTSSPPPAGSNYWMARLNNGANIPGNPTLGPIISTSLTAPYLCVRDF